MGLPTMSLRPITTACLPAISSPVDSMSRITPAGVQGNFGNITNFDAQTFEEVQDDLLPLTTGSFRDDYQELLDAGLSEALLQGAIESSGEIVDGPFIGMASSDRASAVARVVQEVNSRNTPGGRTVFMVLRLDLIKEGNRWKADSLEVLAQSTL